MALCIVIDKFIDNSTIVMIFRKPSLLYGEAEWIELFVKWRDVTVASLASYWQKS